MTDSPRRSPSHHSGPGYAAVAPLADLRITEDLTPLMVRILNHVPESHRTSNPDGQARATEELERHTHTCRERPLRALWVAHRYLQDGSDDIRLHALVLASEALWWLGHIDDSVDAAQAAVTVHPDCAQARWRLGVALYRLGRAGAAQPHLDHLLQHVNQFAPAWALRGQVTVWLSPETPEAAASDFEAAAELDAGSWVVPVRLSEKEFATHVHRLVSDLDADTGSRFDMPSIELRLLPPVALIHRGADPDVRGAWYNPQDLVPEGPLGGLGGDLASGTRDELVVGSHLSLFQRNIETLCATEDMLVDEIQRSLAELLDGALRDTAAVSPGAPEHHAEDADVPQEDPA